ncbi:MAG: hypothetical protein AB1467_05205 [Candidatus Diapherotrites archaeon]
MAKPLLPKTQAETAIELEEIRKLKEEYLKKDSQLAEAIKELLKKQARNASKQRHESIKALRERRKELGEEYLQKLRPFLPREKRLERRLNAIKRLQKIRNIKRR